MHFTLQKSQKNGIVDGGVMPSRDRAQLALRERRENGGRHPPAVAEVVGSCRADRAALKPGNLFR